MVTTGGPHPAVRDCPCPLYATMLFPSLPQQKFHVYYIQKLHCPFRIFLTIIKQNIDIIATDTHICYNRNRNHSKHTESEDIL